MEAEEYAWHRSKHKWTNLMHTTVPFSIASLWNRLLSHLVVQTLIRNSNWKVHLILLRIMLLLRS